MMIVVGLLCLALGFAAGIVFFRYAVFPAALEDLFERGIFRPGPAAEAAAYAKYFAECSPAAAKKADELA